MKQNATGQMIMRRVSTLVSRLIVIDIAEVRQSFLLLQRVFRTAALSIRHATLIS